MTEPTWKDPLLQRWWIESIAVDQLIVNAFAAADVAPYPGVSPATMLVLLCGHGWASDARGKLRSLIDAELARGREAVEVLGNVQEETGYCPCCFMNDSVVEVMVDSSEVYPEHTTDCRLAKLDWGEAVSKRPAEMASMVRHFDHVIDGDVVLASRSDAAIRSLRVKLFRERGRRYLARAAGVFSLRGAQKFIHRAHRFFRIADAIERGER